MTYKSIRLRLTLTIVTRKDGSTVNNVSLQVRDDTAEATLGLWGTSALSPIGIEPEQDNNAAGTETTSARQAWTVGETVLLLQAPGWKIGRSVSSNICEMDDGDANLDRHI